VAGLIGRPEFGAVAVLNVWLPPDAVAAFDGPAVSDPDARWTGSAWVISGRQFFLEKLDHGLFLELRRGA
jgi:hypothetical protein